MSETIEYADSCSTNPILCHVLREEPTGTVLLDTETGERKPGVRLLLQPVHRKDGTKPFWSVAMAKVAAAERQGEGA